MTTGEDRNCCNLSASVALNVRFPMNNAKNNTHIYLARISNNSVIAARDLYCCLLPQCEALRTCRSGFPIAADLRPILKLTALLCLKVSVF